jgi:hypothetical protein
VKQPATPNQSNQTQMISVPVLRRASLAIESIEFALATHAEDPFPGAPPVLNDCDFPSCVEDPLEIIRQTQGDERAVWLEYQDDLECILSELDNCLQQELRSQKKTTWDIQGDEEGEESDNSQGV